MRKWFNPFPLYAPDPAPGGGSDTMLVEPGAPFEHGEPGRPEPVAKPAKSAEQIENENLRKDIERLSRRVSESEETARYWEGRGRQPKEDREPERVIEVRREPEAPAEKPEKLLDDITTQGLDALKRRGVITGPELASILEEHTAKITETIQATRTDAEFSARIANEFPEIAEDSKRLDRGEKPQTELFQVASRIYREMVEDDPALKGTNGALLIAARQAKAQIKLKGKEEPVRGTAEPEDDDRQERRRRRIDNQRPDKSAAGAEGDEDHKDGFSKNQLDIMKHLKVTPENFRKFKEQPRNGR